VVRLERPRPSFFALLQRKLHWDQSPG